VIELERRGRPPESKKSIVEHYKSNPVKWLNDTFDVTLTSYQEDIVNAVFNNRRVGIRSAHGLGKSFCVACVALAFLHLHPYSVVITTAPTRNQIDAHFSPIRKLTSQAKAPLGSEILRYEIRCDSGWYLRSISTNTADRITGFHAEHFLAIVDESCAVDPDIHERIDTLLTSKNSHRLDVGNPYSKNNPFYRIMNSDDVKKFHLKAMDSPNYKEDREVIPGLVSRDWVEKKRDDWGENSDMWRVAVLGEWPKEDEDTLIPVEWVKKAQDRWEETEPPEVEPIYGVDPGGAGTGETVIAVRRGNYVSKLYGWYGLEGPEIIQKIKDTTLDNSTVYIDSVGLGSTLPAYARENDIFAIGVNGAEKPIEREDARNRRAECYLNLRDALDPKGEVKLAIPNDDILAGQLTSIKYKLDIKGRVQLESKKDMRNRGVESPDRGDALAYTFSEGQGSGAMPISVGVRDESPFSGLERNNPFGYVSWSDYRN